MRIPDPPRNPAIGFSAGPARVESAVSMRSGADSLRLKYFPKIAGFRNYFHFARSDYLCFNILAETSVFPILPKSRAPPVIPLQVGFFYASTDNQPSKTSFRISRPWPLGAEKVCAWACSGKLRFTLSSAFCCAPRASLSALVSKT